MNLPKIIGKQIFIRQLQNSDFENWCKADESKEFRLMVGESKKSKTLSIAEKRKIFKSNVTQKDGLNFAIVRKADDAYIGSCRLHTVNLRDQNARFAIGLLSEYFGQGYGTDAIKCVLKFGFKKLHLHRIDLRVLDFNKRGIASYKKCGFKKDGVLRDNAYIDGKFNDDIIMSILESEFNE